MLQMQRDNAERNIYREDRTHDTLMTRKLLGGISDSGSVLKSDAARLLLLTAHVKEDNKHRIFFYVETSEWASKSFVSKCHAHVANA